MAEKVSSGRYVAVPFETEQLNMFGYSQSRISLQKDWMPFDVSQYNQFTTHAGFAAKWAEIPIEHLEETMSVFWSFNSDITGEVSFSGTGKQAINFFRTLKKQWQPELIPEDVFVVSV